MCGRYKLTAQEKWLSFLFNLSPEDVDWAARWNVAPTQEVATIRQHARDPRRIFGLMRWGLIPSWAKDASIGPKAINAVSETAAEKPAFREPMRRQRCLIPADGFYEWKQSGGKVRQPYKIEMADGRVFAFAGLWDSWKDPGGREHVTCTILTTEANPLLKDIHHRMPVILKPEDYDLWLDPGVTNPAKVADLLKPFDGRQMRRHTVGQAVNHVANDGPECAEEIEVAEAAEQLDFFKS
ncbi:MAG TPA: SOS response-associated peptidase [Candidatus Angelobacter sp.]|jgi:putative SOS response-associated peptidase YedK